MNRTAADTKHVTPPSREAGDPEGIRTPDLSPAAERGDVENRSLLFVNSGGMDQTIQSPEIRPRECDCPPDVIRCAHFSTALVALFDNAAHPYPCPNCTADGYDIRWFVTDAIDDVVDPPTPRFYRGDSEADALAAFYAAEAELLGREPETPYAKRIAALPPTKFSTATKEARDRAAQWEP